jgi:hypothetical protein
MTTHTSSRRLVAGAVLAGAVLALALGSQAATSAPTPKPPLANTGGFPQVSTTSATLKGGVNPHGAETSYAFQYGTTTGYGAQTAPVAVGSGTTEVKVTQTIAGLQSGTLYHYRLVATNAAGTTSGGDATFTTKKIPLTFKIAATPDPSVFGSSFSVTGVLSGTGAAGQPIALQAAPFPYLGGFKSTGATAVTDSGGNFSIRVAGAPLNTQFRVVTVGVPVVKSGAVMERVAVRVSLHLRSTGRPGFVRMYGVVEPAVAGSSVGFQLLRPGRPPLSVAGTKVRHASASASRFSRIVRVRRGGLYRAYVQVSNGRQISNHSRAVLIK